MQVPTEHVLLRAYLLKADRPPHVPTFQRIIQAATEHKLLGATVIQGILGSGYHGEAKPSFWSLAERVPVVVEVLDSAERIQQFIQGPLDEIMIGGMLTLERAVLLRSPVPRADAASPVVAAPLELAGRIRPLSTVPPLQRIQTGSHMSVDENGVMLRVFLGDSDRVADKPTYEAIVQKVREVGCSGATVLRGIEGFGGHSVVHKSSLLEMSTDLPIIVEIVDTEDRIVQLLPHLQSMVHGGMITMEYVAIVMYQHADRAATDAAPEHPDAM